MKRLRHKPSQYSWPRVQGKCVLMVVMFFWLSGCSIWNAYLDPNYQSTRADRLCHPYGECLQGIWVAGHESSQHSGAAKKECEETVDQGHAHEWWADSVAKGLEVANCMEKKGYRLQQ